jgi:hypothetical protein
MVRAVAVGATELRSKSMLDRKLDRAALEAILSDNLEVAAAELYIAAENGVMFAYQCEKTQKKFFGLLKSKSRPLRLIDEEGVIRLQKSDAVVLPGTVASWKEETAKILRELTIYDDGGTTLPNLYVVSGKRIIDLSGLSGEEQTFSLGGVELSGCAADEKLILIGSKRTG